MENNFGSNISRLPDPNSFQRRVTYNSSNNSDASNSNSINNRFSKNGGPISSLDGRKWQTRDQAMIANKEYYKKIGRDINHKEMNSEAFNLTNFYHFDKD